jgi:hypothetical protein
MLHALVAAACLSGAFGVPGPHGVVGEPLEFRLGSAVVAGQGVAVRYTTACPAGVGFYRVGVSIAQRTGAHVATATGTVREPCGRRSRSMVLATGGVAFRPGVASARVWGCAGAGCFQVDPLVVVPVRFG